MTKNPDTTVKTPRAGGRKGGKPKQVKPRAKPKPPKPKKRKRKGDSDEEAEETASDDEVADHDLILTEPIRTRRSTRIQGGRGHAPGTYLEVDVGEDDGREDLPSSDREGGEPGSAEEGDAEMEGKPRA